MALDQVAIAVVLLEMLQPAVVTSNRVSRYSLNAVASPLLDGTQKEKAWFSWLASTAILIMPLWHQTPVDGKLLLQHKYLEVFRVEFQVGFTLFYSL